MLPSRSRSFLRALGLVSSLALAACGGGAGVGADAPPLEPAALDAAELERVHAADVMDAEIRHFVREMADMAKDLGFELSEKDPAEGGIERDTPDHLPDPDDLPGERGGGGIDGRGPPTGLGAGGIAGKDATDSPKDVTKVVDPDTGAVVVTKTVHTPSGARTDVVTYHRNGDTDTYITHPGGSNDTSLETSDGSGFFRRRSADESRSFVHYYGPGRVYERTLWQRGRRSSETRLPPRWFNRNPGDDGTWWQKELAEWMWRQHRLGRHDPAQPYPLGRDLVNPGDPDYDGRAPDGPTIWDYVGDLLINPDPTGDAASTVRPSEQAARILREVLMQLGNGFTPGGRPPREDDRGATVEGTGS